MTGVRPQHPSPRDLERTQNVLAGIAGYRIFGASIALGEVMVAMGATIGVLGAYGVGRAAQSLLFGLEGHDPVVFVSAVLLLAAVTFGAGWLPARRASTTQPMMALRHD